ncbi:LacI family DNA-binding transcriptional regulator [Microbacterium sp.]|uniref:LacI family DNA-binding transcriptional regulator n=1 Tax=Microbacterium sp. TaxID=51671 RepID=UPI003C728677
MHDHRAVTLQDIADRVGVTRSTVSNAITGNGRVSESMKEHVLAVARELGYQPNTLARRLRGSRTGIIALRLPRHTSSMSYYMEATFGVVEEAERSGMVVSLIPADVRPGNLQRLHADGVVLLDPDADDPSAHAMLTGTLPVVTGEPVPPGLPPGRAAVVSDHRAAVAELMDHLAERGARRPALVSPEVRSHWAISVRSAFERWCRDNDTVGQVLPIRHPAPPDEVRAAVAELLRASASPVDAIVAGSDGVVLNVVTGAEQAGRRAGTDLLVATVVDSDILRFTNPPITALDLRAREFGRRCVQALRTVLESGDAAEPAPYFQDVVPIALCRRESTSRLLRGCKHDH